MSQLVCAGLAVMIYLLVGAGMISLLVEGSIDVATYKMVAAQLSNASACFVECHQKQEFDPYVGPTRKRTESSRVCTNNFVANGTYTVDNATFSFENVPVQNWPDAGPTSADGNINCTLAVAGNGTVAATVVYLISNHSQVVGVETADYSRSRYLIVAGAIGTVIYLGFSLFLLSSCIADRYKKSEYTQVQ